MPGHGEQYFDLQQVSAKVGMSTKAIRQKVRSREFPPPFRWGGAFRWLASDVDRWMVRNAAMFEINPDDMPEPKKSARKIVEDR
jgi:predicted DNA-binding transcriptional regulator AlpA